MNEDDLVQSDGDISIFELWEKLRDGWRLIIGGSVFGVLGAGIAITVLPARYEATAMISVGQVASTTIESSSIAVERMKTTAFQLKVAEQVGNQDWSNALKRSTSATTRHISVGVVKNSAVVGKEPLIELRVRATSPELAGKIADVSVKELVKRQNEQAEAVIAKIRDNLEISKQKLQSAVQELDSLYKLTANPNVNDSRFTQLSLMANYRIQKESEAFRERQMINTLEASLLPPQTLPAQVLEGVFVAEQPVFPKTGLFLFLGLVGGTLAGVIAVFLEKVQQRSKH